MEIKKKKSHGIMTRSMHLATQPASPCGKDVGHPRWTQEGHTLARATLKMIFLLWLFFIMMMGLIPHLAENAKDAFGEIPAA